MTSHPPFHTLRAHSSAPRAHNIPLLLRHLTAGVIDILSLKHVLTPPALFIEIIMLQGIHCCDSFIGVVFKETGEEVETQGGFTVVVEVPFFEVVGVLFEGG